MCQNQASIGPMLLASGRYRPVLAYYGMFIGNLPALGHYCSVVNNILYPVCLNFLEACEQNIFFARCAKSNWKHILKVIDFAEARWCKYASMDQVTIGLFNSSPPGQNGHNFTDNIFKCIFINEKFSILIWIPLKFVPQGLIDN